MAHKTITISEEAYFVLKSLKKDRESFTDVIIRISNKKLKKIELIAWLDNNEINNDLVDSIECEFLKRRDVKLRY